MKKYQVRLIGAAISSFDTYEEAEAHALNMARSFKTRVYVLSDGTHLCMALPPNKMDESNDEFDESD